MTVPDCRAEIISPVFSQHWAKLFLGRLTVKAKTDGFRRTT